MLKQPALLARLGHQAMAFLLPTLAATGAFHFSTHFTTDPGWVTWEAARDQCTARNQVLAVLRTKADLSAFLSAASAQEKSGSHNMFWIGASATTGADSATAASYKWVDGTNELAADKAQWQRQVRARVQVCRLSVGQRALHQQILLRVLRPPGDRAPVSTGRGTAASTAASLAATAELSDYFTRDLYRRPRRRRRVGTSARPHVLAPPPSERGQQQRSCKSKQRIFFQLEIQLLFRLVFRSSSGFSLKDWCQLVLCAVRLTTYIQ